MASLEAGRRTEEGLTTTAEAAAEHGLVRYAEFAEQNDRTDRYADSVEAGTATRPPRDRSAPGS